jgi:type I restriction enzyme S subunit
VSAELTAQEPSAKYLVNLQPPLVRHFDLIAHAPGGVARLRELILTLAVQGKLVPQDPKETPVDISVIPAAINRLIGEGKVPRSRTSADAEQETSFDDLPNGWVAVIASNVFVPRSGNSKLIKGKLFSEPAEHLYPGYSASGQDVWLSHFEYEGTAVILSAVGARCGKAFLAKGKWSAVANTHIIWPLLDLVLPEYSMLLLNNEGYWIRSGGAQPFVKVTETLQQQVVLPPIAEQSRIVTRVGELMQLCDALEASGQLEAQQHAQLVNTLLGTLTRSETPEALADNWQRIATHFDVLLDRPEAVDALKKTILQLAVRGLLVPQDPTDEPASALLQKIRTEKDHLIAQGKIKRDKPLPPITDEEKPFELPQGWEWVRLRGLVTHLGDGLHGTPNYSPIGEYYFVNGNNLGEGVVTIKPETKRVDQSEFEKHRKPLDSTTVLVSINGTLGRVAFYQNEKIILGKSACYFNVTPGLQKLFAKLLLECPDFMTYAITSSTGTTIKNLGLKAIGDWTIALPPLAEQSRIVTRVNDLRSLCDNLRQSLLASQTVQSHLVDALVTSN